MPSIAKSVYFLILILDAHCIYKTIQSVVQLRGFTSWYQGKLLFQLIRSLIYYWVIMLTYYFINSFAHTGSYEITIGIVYALSVSVDGLILWHAVKKNKTFSTDIA